MREFDGYSFSQQNEDPSRLWKRHRRASSDRGMRWAKPCCWVCYECRPGRGGRLVASGGTRRDPQHSTPDHSRYYPSIGPSDLASHKRAREDVDPLQNPDNAGQGDKSPDDDQHTSHVLDHRSDQQPSSGNEYDNRHSIFTPQ